MKKTIQLILTFVVFTCSNILAQINCSLTEFTNDDFIAAKQEINFTAYIKENDSNVYFVVNEYIRNTYATQDINWEFAGINATGYEATYESPNPGNLQVTLRISTNSLSEDLVLTKDPGTFVLSRYGGLKIKHVKNIEWPSGSVFEVHAPFTHRILNGSINDPDEAKYDFHRALDIVSPLGGNIVAPANGVVYTINNPNEGVKSVRIKHLMDTPMFIHGKVIYNYYTTSGHVENIDPNLNVGDVVCKGENVCEVGASGLNDYFHNHFTISVGTANTEDFLENRTDIANNEQNEFSKAVDSRVNPYLFLDNSINENNSLRYSVETVEDRLRVTVNSDFLEDHFNEISIKYTSLNGEKKELNLNLNTREGLPAFGTTNNRYDYFNDSDIQDIEQDDLDNGLTQYIPNSDIQIFPLNFGRAISGGITGNNMTGTNRVKAYQMIFEFKNFDSFNPDTGDYLRVKDIYGNLGKKTNTTLINYEDFDSGIYDFWTLNIINESNEAIEFNNTSESNPRSIGSFTSIQLKNEGSITMANALSVSEYDKLQVKFSYYNPSIDTSYQINDNFLVQVSNNNEDNWVTINNIVYEPLNTNFNQKGFWYTYTGYIDDLSNFDALKIRIIGDNTIGSADKYILIDYISITGFNLEEKKEETEEEVIINKEEEELESTEFDFKLFPNPTASVFEINVISNQTTVYDLTGRLIKFFDFPTNNFDISSLEQAVYIIKFTTKECIYFERVIKR